MLSIAWMISVLAVCHGCGLKFLEEYCYIVPPQKLDNEKGMKKRPAVYLLKVPFLLLSAYLLVPVVVEVYIPNIIRVIKVLVSNTHSEIEREDLEVILTSDEVSWVCRREEASALIHIVCFIFEIFAFHFEQPKALLIHHVASIACMAARLSPSGYLMTFASDWLWLVLTFHLSIYSLNIIRPCLSFLRHFLIRNNYSSRISSMETLFHLTNIGSWAIVLSGYIFTTMVVWFRDGQQIQQAFMCWGIVSALFFGSLKEALGWSHLSPTDDFPVRVLLQLIREVTIGLFLAPILLLLDFLSPSVLNKFTRKTSHKNTAGGVVAMRALCNASSDERLHIDDPFAIRFVKSGFPCMITKSAVLRYIISLKLETQHPGALGHLITRTMTIDTTIEDLTSRKEKPIRQLVILGAGYDTRAYRLRTLKEVVVIEVDQGFMSSEKQQKCIDLEPSCKELVYLGVDFNKESVADVLNASEKFDPTKPTLFLWEGVQVYLSDDSVDKIFASLRALTQKVTNPKQYMYFTFSDKHIMTPEGRKKIYGGKEFFEYANGIGEQVKSGIDPTCIDKYLLTRGFMPYHYSPCSGLSGHMTPKQKQYLYLSQHPFIRQSEVFHSALVSNLSRKNAVAAGMA